jgi:PadR family transcriptional regulator PadR
MAKAKDNLGSFEEIVLLAILKLGSNAYGSSVRQTVEDATGRSVAVGQIYITTDRLERKGFISSYQGEATPERGGRAKRYFEIESAGRQALRDGEEARAKLAPLTTALRPLRGAL